MFFLFRTHPSLNCLKTLKGKAAAKSCGLFPRRTKGRGTLKPNGSALEKQADGMRRSAESLNALFPHAHPHFGIRPGKGGPKKTRSAKKCVILP